MELPEKYPREHYERKAKRYARALRVLFHVNVDQTTQERWRDLIGFGRAIDMYLDQKSSESLLARTEAVQCLLDQPSVVAAQFPALAVEKLGVRTYERLRLLGLGILRTNLDYRSATTMEDYVVPRRVEGRLYAELISTVATPKVAAQPGYDRFRRWLVPVGEMTNLVDSFTDLPDDFANGEIVLPPHSLSRLHLVGHMALTLLDAKRTADLPPFTT